CGENARPVRTSQCAGYGVQDSARSTAHSPGPMAAQVLHRRVAAVVERTARGYVAGRAASGRAGGSGAVRALAAAPAAYASGTHLSLGDIGARQRGLRHLDEAG